MYVNFDAYHMHNIISKVDDFCLLFSLRCMLHESINVFMREKRRAKLPVIF